MVTRRSRILKEVNPEMARSLIANNISDEAVDESRIHAMAIQMQKGRFDTYGVCLELDSCGHLVSGLLYAHAIVEANAVVKIWIAENRES